jgi:purine-binding chemotaxis protein CheW
MRALLMPVGPDWYAVATESVREVVAQPMLTAVPTGPDALVGLFNLRGEIVPLFDTAALLGIGRVGAGSFGTVVLTELGPAGLAVTGVPEAVEIGALAATEMPAGVGTCSIGGRVATLIDVELLLAPDRLGWLSQ